MRDDDEDAAPPLSIGEVRATPAPVSSAATPGAVVWGACGVYHLAGDLSAFPGERGVIRYVTDGVKFVQPPSRREWRVSLAEPGRYEMKWEGDPADARTLAALRSELETAARTDHFGKAEHPLLAELDAAAFGLVDYVRTLHAAGWSVGLLRPDNVVLFGRSVVCLDLGVTWQGASGTAPWDASPGRPSWVEPDSAFAWLYDHPPVRQQFAAPANGVYPPASPADDVRTLGRLLAWLVSGYEQKALPVVRDAPRAWIVFEDAVAGKLKTADELAGRLRADPPSGYFARAEPVGPPPAAPPRRGKWLVVAIALAVVAAAGTAWVLTREKPTSGGNGEPGRTQEPVAAPPNDASKLDGLLAELDRSPADDVSARLGLLRRSYDKQFDSAGTEAKKKRDAHRVKAIDAWVADYRRTDALAAEPAQRLVAANLFAMLKAEIESLVNTIPSTDPEQATKEKQCLEFVSARVRELSGSQP
jgi:hypothetical protein